MNISELKVYIAAPFFNTEQLNSVVMLESILDKFEISYFSPRSEGVIKEMTNKEKELYMEEIYNSNLRNMNEANTMIAITDSKDTGTIFEIGYFVNKKNLNDDLLLISITNCGKGLNVMLNFGVDCHLLSYATLIEIIKISESEIGDFSDQVKFASKQMEVTE